MVEIALSSYSCGYEAAVIRHVQERIVPDEQENRDDAEAEADASST